MKIIPLMLAPLLLYNLIAFGFVGTATDDTWSMSLFSLDMVSGARWTMTAPNAQAVQRCIKEAVRVAGIHPDEIDLINGHLTATIKDPDEVQNWAEALRRKGSDFPYILH